MKSLISARGIEKRYLDGTHALRGVSLDIKAGEFVAIIGPSGSGKSTLLHILGFLDEGSSGDYYFDGRQYAQYKEEERAQMRNKKMGFVFQMFNLLSRATVYENVRLPLLYSDHAQSVWDRRVRHFINSVGLSSRISHTANILSGGERQRVAIARALVNDPSVVFADEPTGNLDSKTGGAVMDILKKFHSDGRTIILITHDTNIANYANRIIEIRDGTIYSDKKT
jgi:putative ABC transport system ATP-binding protein